MRRLLPLIIIVAALAATLPAQIVNSDHDLRGYIPGLNEVCLPCHAAHNAQGSDSLWNHAIPAGTLFTMYPQSSLHGVIDAEPAEISLLCLGCHDGVTGIDSYGGATGTLNFGANNPRNTGTDLSDDHPISVNYDITYHGGNGLVDPAANPGQFAWGPGTPLFDNKVECLTCHYVHGGGFDGALLRISNAGSALCLNCHIE